ncbi:efflux RND transporter periplasmic adaptor subunit [Oscillochloris sp. ZM17-4]|uniref:HlyD family secretion protein n=1 Tax=Oscillochloris sp. ZM17-4 TaxID=2866714 RepID=UPI001C730A24|nr:efflux RND transporter periplasmic adaptor subunit [Oscillochloris sp. ZM17-4]MBX0328217.1 efflux RND transporter periplasmic adaptor subunit [Oscillochloris sp. ZM17-4]
MHKKILAAALIAAALSACAAPAATPTAEPAGAVPTMVLADSGGSGGPAAGATIAPAAGAPAISLGVTASGEVAAKRTAELGFRVPGTVAAVLVEEGAVVTEGQELATLDTRELDLQVAQAEAQLASAQANYQRTIDGATPDQVAAAQAQVAQAAAGVRQTRGAVTDQDIAAAEANLQQAVARQADIAAGPKATDLQQAQAAVQQASASLEIQRTNLSAAKQSARLQMDSAANALRNAQDAYSRIYWDNRRLEKLPGDLPQALKDQEAQALRGVESAQNAFQQSQVAYAQSQQNEIDGVQASEAQLSSAQASLQKLIDGATADQRAAADAAVAQARANLNKLKGDQRAGQLASAQAGLAAAQANLSQITSDPTEATVAGVLAQVKAAEAARDAAKLNRDKAAIKAPFAGTVSLVNIDPGDLSNGSGQMVIQVVDVSELRIEVNISDTDVAKVREGQSATVEVDAIPGQTFTGKVTYVAPTATVSGTVRTYAVRIVLDTQEGLRAGMSARVSIQL